MEKWKKCTNTHTQFLLSHDAYENVVCRNEPINDDDDE